jgi:homoserine dehydrogenase
MAKISNVLQDQEISIEAIIQKEAASNESVPIVILTHRVKEAKLNKALGALEDLEEITGEIMRIRVEPFHGEAT